MKRLLMISYAFPPNSTAGAVRSERFYRYLFDCGWISEVITINTRGDIFEDRARLEDLKRCGSLHFTRYVDPWLWLRGKKPKNFVLKKLRSLLMHIFSFPDHMTLWIPIALAKAVAIYREKPFDAIYTTSPPNSTHLTGLFLSKLTKKPWIADFRDPWTLNKYRKGGKFKRVALNIERTLEKSVLSNAALVLVNTKSNKRNLLAAFPFVDKNKIVHIPNGWEELPGKPLPVNKKDHSFTIVHAGTFYPQFKPYGLLYAIAAWRNGNKPEGIPTLKEGQLKVTILGSKEEETKSVVRELQLDSFVEIKPWVALDDARATMCQADMLWATLGTGTESATYIPSKLFEYMAVKRPILGFFPEGEAANLIETSGVGIVFKEENYDNVIEMLDRTVRDDFNEFDAIYNPNAEVIESYRIDNITKKLAHCLKAAISRGSSPTGEPDE